ncbi:hypothetical protein EYC80_001342 [Monilinia laxa]|uniref:Uncharacterized protein n=1 Tax=Monilinia laxa TaxID=61186 RepID=A0A5N6K951_MONLA|nr:hypothetical protein EYC80_001342 [Monilinia laxa]
MHQSQRTRRERKLQVLLPIEAAEADLEVDEVEEEVEEVVDSEEVGAEAVEEVSKDWGRTNKNSEGRRLCWETFALPGQIARRRTKRKRVPCMHSLWEYWRFEWHIKSS